MFENETYEVIKKRILDRVPSYIDKSQLSVVYNNIAPIAVEIAQAKVENDLILNETFADTANREYLVRRAKESGIIPEDATNAILKGEFYADDNVLFDITIGSRFTCGNLIYKATKRIDTGIYEMTCETKGTVGNLNTGRMIPVEYIDGLAKAIITEILIPGEDEEDTEIFRNRYLNSFVSKAFGGNRADYINLVNKINGVGACKPERIEVENNPIRITIIDSEYNKPSSALIEIVQNIIDPNENEEGEGMAPYNHIVKIYGVDERLIKVYLDAIYDTGFSFETLKNRIEQKIKDYLFSLRKVWADNDFLIVRHSMLLSEILSIDGILDINEIRLNGENANVILNKYEIPVFDEVVDE